MPYTFSHSHYQKGFTLLELAIVVTTIGLLVGGIVVIRDMIRSSEVQSVINGEDRYKKALQLFKEKYNYLPGDMPTATNFWGTDAGCPNTGYSAGEAVPKTATCNGDGNGRIDTFYEAMRAWQQLADAGFIQGSYSGIQGNASAYSLAIGTDVPASKVPGCGWMIGYVPTTYIVQAPYSTTYQLGTYLALTSGGWDLHYPPCLTPSESYGIDLKIDDGLAYSGNVTDGLWPFRVLYDIPVGEGAWGVTAPGWHAGFWPCASGASTQTQYDTSSSGIYCDPFFYTGL